MTQTKAIIFDIDGTAIPNVVDGMPSQNLIEAIGRAQQAGLIMSCATGRNYQIAQHILKALQLQDPCIVAAGTQIVDPRDGSELWAAHMSEESCRRALELLSEFNPVILVDGDTHATAKRAQHITPKPYRMLDVQDVSKAHVASVIERIKDDEELSVIPVHSNDEDNFFVHITHRLATKEHAVTELLALLKLTREQVTGVGDGANDIELFKSVGTKVAMGNAVDDLKAAADLVVATIDEDGLVDVIEGAL